MNASRREPSALWEQVGEIVITAVLSEHGSQAMMLFRHGDLQAAQFLLGNATRHLAGRIDSHWNSVQANLSYAKLRALSASPIHHRRVPACGLLLYHRLPLLRCLFAIARVDAADGGAAPGGAPFCGPCFLR